MLTKEDLKRQNEEMQRHADQQFREQEALRRRSIPSIRFINPSDSFGLELLIEDIECMEFMHYPDKFKAAGDYLRAFSFSEPAILSILADIPHEARVEHAYLEAVRIQQQRAIEGIPDEESPPTPPPYPVKTLVFGNSTSQPPDEMTEISDAIIEKCESRAMHSEVADGEFCEAAAEPLHEVMVPPATAHPLHALSAPDRIASKKRKKTKLPDDTILISNAHFPCDRAGTIYQSQLEKWVPEIKSLPLHSAFDLFGELNGEMVDLVFYVNRVGISCYVGDEYDPKSRKRKVAWSTANLGPLPNNKKSEKFPFKVVSIAPLPTNT